MLETNSKTHTMSTALFNSFVHVRVPRFHSTVPQSALMVFILSESSRRCGCAEIVIYALKKAKTVSGIHN
jgi:hypothetical protein